LLDKFLRTSIYVYTTLQFPGIQRGSGKELPPSATNIQALQLPRKGQGERALNREGGGDKDLDFRESCKVAV
jgi:hypothetical protein